MSQRRLISPRSLAAATVAAALMLAAGSASAQTLLGTGANVQAALTNTAATVRSGRGAIQWLSCWNPNAAVAYVQFFDVAGAVTVGTTPPKASIPVAPTSSPTALFGLTGIGYTAAIKLAATTTPAGAVAPAAPLSCTLGFQ